ncbi:uncharacterized protein LOC131250716 [Magnolia sinica]|uniref:uncharacterized protein LOC131250716 n=1 Tax=Magnolia sinica TaxID=86752 RepID=UPI002657CC1F|nr:uncharacterized protein LOC131250716 [Magnolia sinica]
MTKESKPFIRWPGGSHSRSTLLSRSRKEAIETSNFFRKCPPPSNFMKKNYDTRCTKMLQGEMIKKPLSLRPRRSSGSIHHGHALSQKSSWSAHQIGIARSRSSSGGVQGEQAMAQQSGRSTHQVAVAGSGCSSLEHAIPQKSDPSARQIGSGRYECSSGRVHQEHAVAKNSSPTTHEATVCQTCGSMGYSELLEYCSICKISAVHCYCSDQMPMTDEVELRWACDECMLTHPKLHSLNCYRSNSRRKVAFAALIRRCWKKRDNRSDEEKKPFKIGSSGSDSDMVNGNTVETNGSLSLLDTIKDGYDHGVPRTHNGGPDPVLESVQASDKCDTLVSMPCCDGGNRIRTQRRRLILADNGLDEEIENFKIGQNCIDRDMINSNHVVPRTCDGPPEFQEYDSHVGTQPIIHSIWRGWFGICGRNYGMISGHLSNKACIKVCKGVELLKPMLTVEMLPRDDAWPKAFKQSAPTDENIGLFFFPENGRDESAFDQLLCEINGQDLALKVILEKTELLIFSSLLLPPQCSRFYGKCYLWGLFKGRQKPDYTLNENLPTVKRTITIDYDDLLDLIRRKVAFAALIRRCWKKRDNRSDEEKKPFKIGSSGSDSDMVNGNTVETNGSLSLLDTIKDGYDHGVPRTQNGGPDPVLESVQASNECDTLVSMPCCDGGNPIRTQRRRLILADDGSDEEIDNFKIGQNCIDRDVINSNHVVPRTCDGPPEFQEYDSHVGTQPIIHSIWRGWFGICGRNYGMISGHLSNKACIKVCEGVELLKPMLTVEMLPRDDAWPKAFKQSAPTDENIGLFFFPENGRDEAAFDQLLCEINGQDLALKVILEKTELLIFSSLLLPPQYSRFYGKCYLWGLFKGRQKPDYTLNENLPTVKRTITIDYDDLLDLMSHLHSKADTNFEEQINGGDHLIQRTRDLVHELRVG